MDPVASLVTLPVELEAWLILGYVAAVLVGARLFEALARVHFEWARRYAERGFQYGLALQAPAPGLAPSPAVNVHMFMEALGHQRHNGDLGDRSSSSWELLPGVHCQCGDNWWLSGGVIVPLNAGPRENGLWQVTCSWTF